MVGVGAFRRLCVLPLQKRGHPMRIPPVWGREPRSLLLSSLLSVRLSSILWLPSFPIPTSSSFPRLWCPWGLAEAPIKPAVNGSNPVINGCVLQTRVWGCCSHGFIRWNGIGTHTHAQMRTLIHKWNGGWMCADKHSYTHTHARVRTCSFTQLQIESHLQLCSLYGCHAGAAPLLPLND